MTADSVSVGVSVGVTRGGDWKPCILVRAGLCTCHEEGRHAFRAVPDCGLHQRCQPPLVSALQVQARVVVEQETHQRHVACRAPKADLGSQERGGEAANPPSTQHCGAWGGRTSRGVWSCGRVWRLGLAEGGVSSLPPAWAASMRAVSPSLSCWFTSRNGQRLSKATMLPKPR